jgi:hypothetical protein
VLLWISISVGTLVNTLSGDPTGLLGAVGEISPGMAAKSPPATFCYWDKGDLAVEEDRIPISGLPPISSLDHRGERGRFADPH